MKAIISKVILAIGVLQAGCATDPVKEAYSIIERVEFKSFYRTSPYSEIDITTAGDGSKTVKYTYKAGPFYNASARIEGLKLEPREDD